MIEKMGIELAVDSNPTLKGHHKGDNLFITPGHYYEDDQLLLSFQKKRHLTVFGDGDGDGPSESWRIHDRVSLKILYI